MAGKLKEKKPQLFCFLICEKVIKEEGSGNASLIGVFNRIFAPRFPAVHARLTIFTAWEWQKKDKKFLESVKILDPNEEPIGGRDNMEVIFNEDANRAYTIVSFLNLKFPTPGFYKVQLFFEGKQKPIRETLIELKQVSPK